MKKFFAAIISVLLIFSIAGCSSEKTKESNDVTSSVSTIDLETKIDDVLETKNFKGIVYVTKNGSEIYKSATGKDSNGNALNLQSNMLLGSISKQFCATAILMLRDMKKLSLDDKLQKYYPEYTIGKNITIKNLLTMRSGIQSDVNVEVDYSASLEELNKIAKEAIFNTELGFEPDSKFEYSNVNYFLLSDIVEIVSEKSYNEFVHENIFEVLGMQHTGFISEAKENSDFLQDIDLSSLNEAELAGTPRGAGDIISNAFDMDLWMTGLSTGKLISKESYEEMTQNYSPNSATPYGYGLEPMVNGVGHSGFIGTYCAMVYFGDKNGYNIFIASPKSYNDITGYPNLFIGE